MSDTEIPEPRRRGRPATGETPKRQVRIGSEWERAEAASAASGLKIAAYVEQALKRENDRVERQQLRATQSE